MPPWWNAIEVLSRLSTKVQVASGVLLVFTIVASFIAVKISNRLDHLHAENRQLQERLRLAEAAQESLRKQLAAGTASQTPRPQPPATRAPRRDRAQRPHPPRHIDPEQQRQFVAFMKGKPRGRIGLLTVIGDNEAHAFAVELERMLKEAGLDTDGVGTAVFYREVPRGLLLRLRSAEAAPPQATSIQLALEHIGLHAPGTASQLEPANSVTLIVGRNPES